MNFADIQNTWRSPHNQPSAAEIEQQKLQLVAELRRHRRADLGLLCITLVPLAFFTFKVVVHVLWPDPALKQVDLAREWAIVPFFALPWIGWLVLLRKFLSGGRRHPNYDASINASLQVLLEDNRRRRDFHRVVGALLVASVLVLLVIVQQLRAVGKAGDEILVPAWVIYPGYVAAMVAWIVWHERKKLAPRRRELEALLSSYR